MDKRDLARALDEIAKYLELREPNRFKALAFERAAKAVTALDRDLGELIASRDLYKTAGIGERTGAVIEELVRSDRSRYLDELRKQYPAGIFELLRVPGLGLKKIGILFQKLGIGSLDELEAACRANRLTTLRGFGAKTQQKILEGIEKARRNESRFLLPAGIETGETLRELLGSIDEVENAEISGSVRRRLEIIRNVNIVIATRQPTRVMRALSKIIDRFEAIDQTTAKGVGRNEMDVFLHLARPENFGSTMLRTTGSTEFVAAFLERAGEHAAAKEEEIFRRAQIPFVTPERRENTDDLRLKKRRSLVELSDLRGTFHVHTTYSDGRNTVREMLSAARQRDFQYVGISDHSKTAYYAGGLTVERLREQQAEIDERKREVKPLRVFKGTEVDILTDGAIDYDDETLATFDFAIASIHSKFAMPKDEMTERILRALDNPFVTFLGHLTGRLLLSRDGYTMDFDRVFEKAAKVGVMIEINGNPRRLDIDWRLVGRALDRGVRFSIHPDAHSIHEYAALISGTWAARKAGLSPKEIFNTKSVDEVEEYLKKRKL
jgi:DNA polymerase (family 10)